MWKAFLKTLGVAAAAGAAKAAADTVPNLLPPELGNIVSVGIATALAYLLKSPLKAAPQK